MNSINELDEARRQITVALLPLIHATYNCESLEDARVTAEEVAKITLICVLVEQGFSRMLRYEKVRGVSLDIVVPNILSLTRSLNNTPIAASAVTLWMLNRPYFELFAGDGGWYLGFKDGAELGPVLREKLERPHSWHAEKEPGLIRDGLVAHRGNQHNHDSLIKFHMDIADQFGLRERIEEVLW